MNKDQATRDREAGQTYSQKEWDEYQEHLKIGGNQLHVRSFLQLGFEHGIAYAHQNPSDEVRELLEAAQFTKSELEIVFTGHKHLTAYQKLTSALAKFEFAVKGK